MNQTPARLKSSSFLNHDPTAGVSYAILVDSISAIAWRGSLNSRIRCVPPNDDASKNPVIARKIYRCQLYLISDWQKAMIAHVICSVGRRYGALQKVRFEGDMICCRMAHSHLGFRLQSHERDLAYNICRVVWIVNG